MITYLIGFLYNTVIWYTPFSTKADIQLEDNADKIEAFTAIITQDDSTQEDKVRSIYKWIANNVSYDVEQINNPKIYTSEEEISYDVYLNGKGLCQHYSQLFHDMCESQNIVTYVIEGYTSTFDSVGHAWNIVKIDSNYYLIDVTWSAGYVEDQEFYQKFDDIWYMPPPEEFIYRHMPFDPMWQLLTTPISHSEYLSKDFSKISGSRGSFNFVDSIGQHDSMNEANQLTHEIFRIKQSGISNELINRYVRTKERYLDIIELNKINQKLNKGIDYYNQYILSRNKMFKNPKLSNEEILEIISIARSNVLISKSLLKQFILRNSESESYFEELNERAENILLDVEREYIFVQKYLSKSKLFRDFLFYSRKYNDKSQ